MRCWAHADEYSARDPGTNRPIALRTPYRLTRDADRQPLGLHLAPSPTTGKRGILHSAQLGTERKPPACRAPGTAPPRAAAAMPPGAARPLRPALPEQRRAAGPGAGRHRAARHRHGPSTAQPVRPRPESFRTVGHTGGWPRTLIPLLHSSTRCYPNANCFYSSYIL